jgi:hypothetical protein
MDRDTSREEMMSRLFGPIFQTAYVVEDIDNALDHWTGTLGVGPFFMLPTPLPFTWMKRDEELIDNHALVSHVALAHSGDMMIELIRPGSAASPYCDFLNAGRRGVHHLGAVAKNYDAQMATIRAAGIHVALEGEMHASRFSYLATDDFFPGTMIELIEVSQETEDLFAMIKIEGSRWDGTEPVRILG